MFKLLLYFYAQVAQLVEQATENRCVGGSIPPLGTMLKNFGLIFFTFSIISCDSSPNFIPDKQGLKRDYKIIISSDYTGSKDEKRVSVENIKTRIKKDGTIFHKLYSNGNLYSFFKNKSDNALYRTGAIIVFDDGFDEPVKKEILPSFNFKFQNWKVTDQLFITKGFQPPLRDFKPSALFDMKYSIISSNIRLKVKAGEFENCIYVKGNGNTEFIADTRSGPNKVQVLSEEWYCPEVGLVKHKRVESTDNSAFGTQKYYKELIRYQE